MDVCPSCCFRIVSLDRLRATGDEKTGVRIVRDSLAAPLRQIAANAGAEPGTVLHTILRKSGPFGYDADRGEYTNMFQAGILDPTKVVRCALENGSSVARILLSTDCIVASKPEEEEAAPGAGEAMDMM